MVGAGVGGLAVAAALRRRGVEAEVFEQATRLRQSGAGLSLYANAVAALRELRLEDVLDGIAEPVERVVFLSARGGGRFLNEAVIGRTAGVTAPSVSVHREELLGALARAAGDGAMTFGARCVGFKQDAGGVAVRFEGGAERRSGLLVGADGAGSAVRREVRGEEEDRGRGRRWAGWHGVAPARPEGLPERAIVFVLSGSAGAGLFPLTRDRLYWFLDDPAHSAPSADGSALGTLLERAAGWPSVVRKAVDLTPPGSVSRVEVRDLPPGGRWGIGRVTLLGDAAHPMLPTLGQGACQAIEDAAALVGCLKLEADAESALRAYERRRYRRVASFVRASRRSWDLRRRVPAGPRDALLRAAPPRLLSHLLGRSIRPATASR